MKYLVLLFLNISLVFANLNFGKDFSFTKTENSDIKATLSSKIIAKDQLVTSVDIDGNIYEIKYAVNQTLNDEIKKIIKKYRSDYTAVAVIDNNTGAVLSLADYSKKENAFGINLALSNKHPAASLFKMITAADLLSKKSVEIESKYSYHGRGVTLYKSQLKPQRTRWSREIDLKKAFAFSNNVIFGKAAIKDSNYLSIKETSSKFGFNNNILQFLDIPQSHILDVKNEYELAELASGFNRTTTISPLHAASMASLVVNDGIEKKPYIVSKVIDKRIDKDIWSSSYGLKRVLSKSVARDLREMMRQTVKTGTASGSFKSRKLPKKLRNYEIGGKTGTITGGIPFGRRDWFVSYAKPEDDKDLGISVAVMIINQKKWFIKSPVIARDIMKYYFEKIK